MDSASNDNICCDRCGRNISGKNYINYSSWIICGICEYEAECKNILKDYIGK